MFLVSSRSCLCAIYWNQVLSREWRCSRSSADRRCSNYTWMIKNFIAYWSVNYIRDLTVTNIEVSISLIFIPSKKIISIASTTDTLSTTTIMITMSKTWRIDKTSHIIRDLKSVYVCIHCVSFQIYLKQILWVEWLHHDVMTWVPFYAPLALREMNPMVPNGQ